MKKIVITTAILLAMGMNTAYANCPSGRCEVEINCTTGVVTYRDAPPAVAFVELVRPEPVLPTHTISVQTANAGWGTSGTPEQIAVAVASLAPAPITTDPCLNGGCTKVEVNATTGVTTISALTEADLKQRAVDKLTNSQRQAELAKAAYQALPNITTWQPYDPFAEQNYEPTVQDLELNPEWWDLWFQSITDYYKNYFWWWAL